MTKFSRKTKYQHVVSTLNFIFKKVFYLLVIIALIVPSKVKSQVSTGYVWSQSLQTYTSGVSTTSAVPALFGTNWDDNTYTGYTLPFAFKYNGVNYLAGTGILGIDSDGWAAFSNGPITMTGTTVGGSWVSASNHTGVYLNGTANNNGFCGFNGDMVEQVFSVFTGIETSGSPVITSVSDFSNIRVGIRLSGTGIPTGAVVNAINVAGATITLSTNATASGSQSITPRSSVYAFLRGIAPYRQFVVQWTRTSRYSVATGDDFTFQLVLNEGGGNPTYQTLQAVYGSLFSSTASPQNSQVGLRGNNSGDFNARTTTTNWSATAAALANTNTCSITPSVFPVSGLTYTWSPPCPSAATNAGALSGAVSVCPNTSQDYTLAGVPGAIYYLWSYSGTNTTYSGVTTLPLNTLNFGATATSGTLTVTPGNLCGNGASASLAITVASVASATISYPAPSSYCISTAGTKTPTLSGPAGGAYSSSPSGLSIVSASGIITPSSSLAGTYTVTYTYSSGTCSALTASTTVTIGAIPSVSVTATPSIVCSGGSSQLQAVGAAPGNYTVSSIAYSANAPTETPIAIFDGNTPYSGADTISAAIPLPFNFTFYGVPVTQLYVSENGYIQLQNGPDPASNTAQALPNPAPPNNVIALVWADLVLDTLVTPGANVRYFVNGSSPNQVFTIEYTGLSFFGTPNVGNVTGQIRLFESDNHIEVALVSVTDAGLGVLKTTGIENSLGTIGIAAPGRNGLNWNVSSPEAWAFYPKGVSYLWTPSTFLNSNNIQNPVAGGVTANTTYNVKVTDASTGCFASSSVTVSVGTPLNGVYTVGVAGNYPTLTAAIYAYNNLCISGPVTFSLIDATYSTSETFPITINSNIYASPIKTLTIKPATNVTITGSNVKALIKLNGADYVIIDGSKTSGGVTRDLTITNTSNKVNGAVVWLSSASNTNGATNDTIKNCSISGFSIAKTSFLLVSSGSTIGGLAASANTKNTFLNNQFTKAQSAIVLVGPTGNETGNLVSGNLIGSTVAASKIGLSGIELYQQANCKVFNNSIAGITTASTNTTSGISVFGTASGITIDANKISDVKNTNSIGFGANGVCLASTSPAANVSVTNNFIFDIAGKGYTGREIYDNGYGIIVDDGAGYFIDFNTVVLNTNQLNSGYPAALNISSNVTINNAVTIRNNILGNTQTQAGEHYTIQSSVAKTKIALIDYNDYYLTSGNLGYLGSNRATLANIIAGFGGNASSQIITPIYVSATDYHIVPASNAGFTNLGTPVTGITTDIDTTTRNGLNPDIGADEWLMPNTGSWVGKTSIDWLVPSNWETNTIPTGTTDVVISGGYAFMPTIVTTQAVRGLELKAPVTANTPILTLNNGTIQINGTILRTGGSINGANGTVEMNGTAAQTIPASLFAGNNLKNLVIGNSNATGVTIAGTLDIYRSLTFSAAGLKLTTGNFLTFKSTATETAWLGNMSGKAIAGNATVERYIPTGINHGKSWQLLSVPVSGTQSVRASWQEGQLPTIVGPANYGTTISSEKPAATSRGYDFVTTTGPSMKTYDPLTNTFLGIDNGSTNTSTLPIANQKGYMILVRGDRSVQTSTATATPTTLRTNGKLYTTGADLPPATTVLANKFATIGNPYASAIDFTAITRAAGVDNVFYVWDPLLAGSYSLGGYQTISSAVGYLPTPGSTNYPSGTPCKTIQSGQAFYVHGTAGGNVSFTEAAKIAGSKLVQRSAPVPNQQLLRLNLYKISNAASGPVDGNAIVFDGHFSNEYESMDALKISNSSENIGVASNGKILAVEARKPVVRTDTIFYNISNLRHEGYQLRFGPQNVSTAGLEAFLADRYLNSLTAVSLTDSSFIEFTVTTDPASSAADRFYLIFKPAVAGPVSQAPIAGIRKISVKSTETAERINGSISVYPNPVVGKKPVVNFINEQAGSYFLQLNNQLGQPVYESKIELSGRNEVRRISLSKSVPAGNYQLIVTHPDGDITIEQIVIK